MSENDKRRISQLEEQLSNTLQAVDKLHSDVETFKDYAIENNKVVNSILRRMDERDEQFLKMNERMDVTQLSLEQLMKEMIAERQQRNTEIDIINRRLDKLDNQRNPT